MSRIRRPRRAARPRRGPDHCHQCVRLVPPAGDPGIFFGFCEELGLWRVHAHGFEAHGVIKRSGEAIGFSDAIRQAADSLGADHPEAAEQLASLLKSFNNEP